MSNPEMICTRVLWVVALLLASMIAFVVNSALVS
jgi:hypothetical protein